MNTKKLLLIALAALGWALSACERDRVQPVRVQVQVSYPASYRARAGAGITVTLKSATGGETQNANTGADGLAVFESVIPGLYDVSSTQTIADNDALNITGVFNRSLTLNAAQTGVTINAEQNIRLNLELSGAPSGSLVIKEVYYTGSRTPSGGNYFSDQFVEIYNNSSETVFLDGLCIADLFGVAGQINPTNVPTPFASDRNHVYASNVWRIPGSGRQHPLQPSQSIIIAQDGINHRTDPVGNPSSPVDLSTADWETFNQRDDNRDTDAPNVPNLERLYFTGGFDWLMPVFGPALVIFRTDNFAALQQVPIPDAPTQQPRIRIPNALVIDAFEALQNAQSSAFKRVPPALDAGFVFARDTYTGESARRKTAVTTGGRRVLQDLNNTSQDFEILARPTPKGF
jgi:hypothetical protein